jgi:hypothetical protein
MAWNAGGATWLAAKEAQEVAGRGAGRNPWEQKPRTAIRRASYLICDDDHSLEMFSASASSALLLSAQARVPPRLPTARARMSCDLAMVVALSNL